MKESGRPIYYCQSLNREQVKDPFPVYPVEHEGEIKEDISFTFYDLTTETTSYEKIFNDDPYNISKLEKVNIDDVLNLEGTDGCNYRMQKTPSQYDYVRAYKELQEMGVPKENITAKMLKEYLQDLTPETNNIKKAA